MRTPGNDFELAVGFCVTEGLLRSADDLDTVAYCLAGQGEQEYNVVTVKVRSPSTAPDTSVRSSPTRAAGCAARPRSTRSSSTARRLAAGPVVARSVLTALPDRLRAAQTVFDATGGLHAAARFTPPAS